MDDVARVAKTLGPKSQTEPRKITKKRLVDSLNYLNFQKNSIIVNLEHASHHNLISLRAHPQPCSGDVLHCLWADPIPTRIASSYNFQNFLVDRGLDLLIVDAQPMRVTDDSVTFLLPDSCQSLNMRESMRYEVQGVKVTLMQDNIVLSGTLDDFTTTSFRVLVSTQTGQEFDRINKNTTLRAIFFEGNSILYTGECKTIRQMELERGQVLVFEHIRDISVKPYHTRRNNGHTIVPLPNVAFNHPLSKKRVNMKADEISSCWFSVIEHYDRAVLFAGLVMPRVELEVAPGFSVMCDTQVAFGDIEEDKDGKMVKWWIKIQDMGIEDQGKLFSMLQRAKHEKSYALGRVDPGDLLEFFFKTGLVYPKKYNSLQKNKEQLKEIYKKLYLDNPSIARHFLYIEENAILGHLSMIRFYESTWMLYHHASLGKSAAGLAVLNQARDYVYDYRNLHSSNMDFLICYFRPDNKFPNRVFGGFYRDLENPRICSIDAFAYSNVHLLAHNIDKSDGCWELCPAKPEDLSEFSAFYDQTSGGLMTKVFDIEPEKKNPQTLSDEYERLGLKREKYLFSLKKDGKLKSLAMAVVSDAGLNLSNLTNCIHVFVVDPQEEPADVVDRHLAKLASYYEDEEIPLLLHPLSYAESRSLRYEKVYNLWAFDTRYTGRFYEYMDKMLSSKRVGTQQEPIEKLREYEYA